MKPSTLIAWENGPTGGDSSGEVIAVLLMTNSLWIPLLDGQDGGAGGGARFQCLVGISSILERIALIDVYAHLPRSHHIEQLVSGSLKLFSSCDVVEEQRPPAVSRRPRYEKPPRRIPVWNRGWCLCSRGRGPARPWLLSKRCQ